MKILIVGGSAGRSLEIIYMRYLKEVFPETIFFDIANEVNYSTLISKIRNRLHDRSIFNKANKSLLDIVEELRPDIVWVFKGVEIHLKTLMTLKKSGIKLVNYNPDHPFVRTTVSHGSSELERCVSLYDLHFCYSRLLSQKIQNEFGIKSVWLPFGYDISDACYAELMRLSEIKRICFVGNPDPNRKRIIMMLAKAGLEVDVYGVGWNKYLPDEMNIGAYQHVGGERFWEVLRRYRLQLNIFRPHNANSHNMRTFEIPAAGAIQLAPESDEHREFFEEGKEIYQYKNLDDLLEKANVILSLSTEAATTIRHAARERSINDGYSYKQRSSMVISSLAELA